MRDSGYRMLPQNVILYYLHNNTCGCGPLLCMAGILVPFSNELITGVRRGLVGPLIYMAELSQHHLIQTT